MGKDSVLGRSLDSLDLRRSDQAGPVTRLASPLWRDFSFRVLSLPKLLGPEGCRTLVGQAPFQRLNRLPLSRCAHLCADLRRGHQLVPQQAMNHEQVHAKVVETRAGGARKLARG